MLGHSASQLLAQVRRALECERKPTAEFGAEHVQPPSLAATTERVPGRVLAQRPRAGVAAAANMTVKLVVGRA